MEGMPGKGNRVTRRTFLDTHKKDWDLDFYYQFFSFLSKSSTNQPGVTVTVSSCRHVLLKQDSK